MGVTATYEFPTSFGKWWAKSSCICLKSSNGCVHITRSELFSHTSHRLLRSPFTGSLGSCNTVHGVLFTTLYFHEFCENCVIRENLIRELQYLRERSSWKLKRKLSACNRFVKISHLEKYPAYGSKIPCTVYLRIISADLSLIFQSVKVTYWHWWIVLCLLFVHLRCTGLLVTSGHVTAVLAHIQLGDLINCIAVMDNLCCHGSSRVWCAHLAGPVWSSYTVMTVFG